MKQFSSVGHINWCNFFLKDTWPASARIFMTGTVADKQEADAQAEWYEMAKSWERVETCINKTLCGMAEKAAKELLELTAAKEKIIRGFEYLPISAVKFCDLIKKCDLK